MTDDKTVTEVMQPQVVNVVGTGDGGITRNVTVKTPADQPDLKVRYIAKLEALGARFAHTFISVLGALVVAGMATDVIPYADFLDLVRKCAGLSLTAASADLLKSLGTITSQWARDHPLLSGEV